MDSKLETTTIRKLFYNGTGICCLLERSVMEEMHSNALKEQLKDYTIAEIKAGTLKDLVELEEGLFAHSPDAMDAKVAMKFWGAKSGDNYCRWTYGILTLLKLKVIKNDDQNGWWEMTGPTEFFRSLDNVRVVKPHTLFQTCECCGHKSTLKKCGGCKKVYYCGAECQKSHWKTHKPNCC
jgi:hypothetical protein